MIRVTINISRKDSNQVHFIFRAENKFRLAIFYLVGKWEKYGHVIRLYSGTKADIQFSEMFFLGRDYSVNYKYLNYVAVHGRN